MADSKITALTDGTPVVTDIVPYVSNPGGTPVTKKSTVAHLFASVIYPRGFLINGKIVPSVTTNNLTVAIKGLDGNDPSATNPVYCRIGDVIYTITAALSVTKNAGTNWCGAGVELAINETDFFVYLGYNATDGVVIGFSRICHGTEYDSFSATTTADGFCAISTITNAAAGDDYELIGRFAATLSGGAGYTWSVPTFTNKNLIQRPIYETRWLAYSPVYTGFSAIPTQGTYYKIVPFNIYFWNYVTGNGTSNDTVFTMTIPYISQATNTYVGVISVSDNSVGQAGPGYMIAAANSKVISLFKSYPSVPWTASGAKSAGIPITMLPII